MSKPVQSKAATTPAAISGPVYPGGIPAFAVSFGAAPAAPDPNGWPLRCHLIDRSVHGSQLDALTLVEVKNGLVVLLPPGSCLHGTMFPLGTAGEWNAQSTNGKGPGWKVAGVMEKAPSATGEFIIRVSGITAMHPTPTPNPPPVATKPASLAGGKNPKLKPSNASVALRQP